MSVRTRFAVTVAAVIAVTVALFATLSIVAIDRALRSGFDARLRTAAQAVSTTVDVHSGTISVDAGDLRELAALHEDTPFAILGLNGALLGGSALPAAPGTHSLATVTVPIVRDGHTVGSAAVWQSDAWIGDFDRVAAIVSIVVGLLLVALGVAISTPVAKTYEALLNQLGAALARERQFVADASHELRAPLAVLHAETELALRRERTADEYRVALESIARESARLEALVDELLAAARADVDAGERERLDAGSIVRGLQERLKPAAALKGVELEVSGGEGAYVEGNPAMVERALLAIAHNAIAFARGCVRLTVTRDGATVRIDVCDDGRGFTPEALQHATERFWRADSARSRGGTGLGLAIARSLLEANGGRIALANGGGGGAVVSAYLPSA